MTNKPKAGRPPLKVTDDVIKKVESLAATGLNLKEIASVLGIHYDTLNEKKKEFSEFFVAIGVGRSKGIEVIKNKFFEKAKDGDNHCMTMYLKNYSDLTDRHDVKHSGDISVNVLQDDVDGLSN